jgi:hypothetical protein
MKRGKWALQGVGCGASCSRHKLELIYERYEKTQIRFFSFFCLLPNGFIPSSTRALFYAYFCLLEYPYMKRSNIRTFLGM